MPPSVNVAFAASVHVVTPVTDPLELLGWTRNGVDFTSEPYWLDVPGDQNGGDDGPPIEIQWLGEIARVRLELTKWDTVVESAFRARVGTAGFSAGTGGVPGTIVFGNTAEYRLNIQNPTPATIVNFPRAIPRQPVEINYGTKYSILVCEFECHKDANGVLYNTAAP